MCCEWLRMSAEEPIFRLDIQSRIQLERRNGKAVSREQMDYTSRVVTKPNESFMAIWEGIVRNQVILKSRKVGRFLFLCSLIHTLDRQMVVRWLFLVVILTTSWISYNSQIEWQICERFLFNLMLENMYLISIF